MDQMFFERAYWGIRRRILSFVSTKSPTMAQEESRLRRLRGADFAAHDFYDCGAYGLFTLATEHWQPTFRGKRVDPKGFKPNTSASLKDPAWETLGPIVEALEGQLHILDVGGYIGTFTIPLALAAERHGYRLSFDIFEPGPTRHVLARNIEINGLADRVRLHDAAMSNTVGQITYRWRGNGAIGGQVFAKSDTTDSCRVAAVTIDHIAKNMDGPLLIKLDTQGHEAMIMGSARETIAAKKAIWHIEFIWWQVRDKFDGERPFYRYIFDEFLVFDGGKHIDLAQIDIFMANLRKRQFEMADLTLVPKDAPFTNRVIERLFGQNRESQISSPPGSCVPRRPVVLSGTLGRQPMNDTTARRPTGSTGFGKYSFFDCGSFGLFTLSEERFQPIAYGKKAYSPEKFFTERASRRIDPSKIRLWNELGPALKAIGSGGTVLDVGGYIGTFCIPLSLAAKATGLDLTFHSFEPGPTRELLAINVQTNDLSDRVHIYDAAVSGFDGHAIYRFKSGGSIGGAVFGNPSDNDMERVAPCYTVDRFCADIPGNLFIKLDTQGHEADIMKAARSTIAQKRAIWQIEFMAWVARKDFGGQTFADFLLQEFHAYEGARPIHPGAMSRFLDEVDARPSRMADLLLVPKDADFATPLLHYLRHEAK